MEKIYITDTVFYNKGSSVLLGWDPTWFGLDVNDFGEELEYRVKKFQEDHNIKIDGLVGPMTYTRLKTAHEADEAARTFSSIYCGLKEINLEDVVSNTEKFYNKFPAGNYKRKDLTDERPINKIVIHWDAALSSQSCFDILKKRGYSSHFSIDNDGTIYQLLNTSHIAYHVKETNDNAIGIDVSNAFYLKYNKIYEKRGFGLRPIITSKVNGRTVGPHLGYYPSQIKALKKLIGKLCETYDIPLVCPIGLVAKPKLESGVMFHYNINDGKIDAAGIPLKQILDELSEEKG